MEYTSRRKRKINKSMKTIRIKKRKEELWCPWWSGKRENTTVWTKGEQKGTKIFGGFQEKKLLVSDKEAVVSSQVIRHRSSSLSWHFHQPLNYQHITIVPRKKQQQKLEDIFCFFFSKKNLFPANRGQEENLIQPDLSSTNLPTTSVTTARLLVHYSFLLTAINDRSLRRNKF